MDIKIKGIYKPFKGDLYIIEDIAKHSETLTGEPIESIIKV